MSLLVLIASLTPYPAFSERHVGFQQRDLVVLRREQYNQLARKFLADGILTEEERWKLEQLRRELGLGSDEALQLLRGVIRRAKAVRPESCPHCGERLD